jgi:large subunit ribosomal protein L6
MKNFKKKHSIKIPKNIQVIYCDQKNIITFVGPLATKSLKLNVKLFLLSFSNTVIVSRLPVNDNLNVDLKSIKKLQGTMLAKIKQVLIEITYVLHHKLNLVGVGYRAFMHEKLSNQIYLKLGYSHLIYFKIPTNTNVYCYKFTKLFIFGECSYDNLTQIAAQIRSCKSPEPYKGKGVLHDQEKVVLKKGKKI